MPQAHSPRYRVDPASWPPRGVPEVERDEPTPIQHAYYHCPRGGHDFEVPFSDAHDVDVAVPEVWRCRHHGVDCAPVGQEDLLPPPPEPGRLGGSDGRDHWDRLLERRTIPELHALLLERLALLEHGTERLPLAPLSTGARTVGTR